MYKILYFALFFFISSNLFSQIDSFSISGRLKGLRINDILYLKYKKEIISKKEDTIIYVAKGETFSFKAPYFAGPIFYSLKKAGTANVSESNLRMLLDNHPVIIKGSISKLSEARVTGSKSNQDFIKYNTQISYLNKRQKKSEKELNIFDSLMHVKMLEYIRTHSNSLYNPLIILDLIEARVDKNKIKSIFDMLPVAVRSSFWCQIANAQIKGDKKVEIDTITAKNRFLIKGFIKGLKTGDTISVNWIKNINSSEEDSISQIAFGEKFLLPVPARNGPYFYKLKIIGRQKGIDLFLDNSDISVIGDINDFSNTIISGSDSHKDYINYENYFSSYELKEESYVNNIKKINEARDEFDHQFVKDNPNSQYSAVILLTDLGRRTKSAQYVKSYFDKLNAEVKNSKYGREIEKTINILLSLQINATAPDFVSTDITNKSISLNNVLSKNKIVLLDFWASWCRPCREENPFLVKLYEKYHHLGFEIVGVSLDEKSDNWKKAIENDSLSWINVSDLKGMSSPFVSIYNIVQGIPDNYLINSKGKIIAKKLKGEALELKILEALK